MFKHSLVVAAAFLLVVSVISAETNAPLLPTQSGAMPVGPATPAAAQPPAPSKAVSAQPPAPSKAGSAQPPAPSKAVSSQPPAPSKAVSAQPPAPSKAVSAQPPAISTPAKVVEASAVDPTTETVDPTTETVDPTTETVDPTTEAVDPTTETGSDEDLEALADMHDEEVEDAEEDSDLDGVSAARAIFYFASKYNILPSICIRYNR
jgi:hypothetical protein